MMIDMDFGSLNVMGRDGHTKITWSGKDPEEVKTARDMFNQMRAKGYRAFKVEPGGGAGAPIDSFDPGAGEMVMIPQLAGG